MDMIDPLLLIEVNYEKNSYVNYFCVIIQKYHFNFHSTEK